MTVFIYLNNVESGGETSFPNYNKKVKPSKGKCIMWENVRYSSINACSLHSGDPPKSGIKWGLTCWIRETPYKIQNKEILKKIHFS